MSETSALRPGQKVTLTATVSNLYGPGRVWIEIDNAWTSSDSEALNVPLSALTPVVDPEPQWHPGDVVRIDGVNHMLRTDGIWRGWESSDARTNFIDERNFSELWAEGRVVVVYRKEADK